MGGTQDSNSKEIRVFVSSTFMDLNDERDYIIRRTFPRLAEYCRKRGIKFTGVDLRWGITEEQSKDGRTIRLCLDEIRKCQPFFINIIGQRYGWIPSREDIEKDEELGEKYRSLIEQSLEASISITEMEIIEGVFSKPSDKARAFFFLGDEEYYRKRNIELNIEEEDDYKKERLRRLKERIRSCEHIVFEDFKGKEELGEDIYNCLKKAIDEKYPEDENLTMLQRENLKHCAFALSRKDYYLKNDSVFNMLDNHVGRGNEPLLIWGESGSGKSALLSNWAEEYRARNIEVKLIEHYVGASSETEADMFRHLLLELGKYEELDEKVKNDDTKLKRALVEALKNISGKVVIVIDAVNQLQYGVRDLGWITEELYKNIDFIISTTDEKYVKRVQKRGWSTYKVKPLNKEEIATIVKRYLDRHGKSIGEANIDLTVKNEAYLNRLTGLEKFILDAEFDVKVGHVGNPMFLKILLNELILNAKNDTLEAKIVEYLNRNSIAELIDKVFDRLESDFGEETVKFILGHIFVSRNGISEQELAIMANEKGIPYIDIVECIDNLSTHLMNKGELLYFFHEHIRSAVRKRYVSDKEKEMFFRRSIAASFKSGAELDRRIEEVPYQLYLLDDCEELKSCISEKSIFTSLSREEPYTLFKYVRRLLEEDASFVDDFFSIMGADEEQKLSLAELLYNNRNYYAAEKVYMSLYQDRLGQAGTENMDTSAIIKKIIKVLTDEGKYDEAQKFAEKDKNINVSCFGEVSIETAKTINNYALIELRRNNIDRAIELFRMALNMKKKCDKSSTVELLCAEEKLYVAMSHDTAGDYRVNKTKGDRKGIFKNYDNDLRAVKLKEILELKKKDLGELHPEIAISYINLGDFCTFQKDSLRAEDYYKKAQYCLKEIYGEGHLAISDISIKLKNYEKAWLIRQNILGVKHPETLAALELYQNNLQKIDGKEALIGTFLEYIKSNQYLPEQHQLDELLEKPRVVKKLNRNLLMRYTLPNTIFLFVYLAAVEAVLPLKWFSYAMLIFNLQLMHLGYVNGRNKNYFAFADIAVFAFLPLVLTGFSLKSGNAVINTLSYDLIMMWIHKFDFDTVLWLGANLKNIHPNLILERVMPRYTLFSLGMFRYSMFALMALLGLSDNKFALIRENVRKNFYLGGENK